MNSNRLVVFGCSYANGEETLYDELGPELNLIRKENKDPRHFFSVLENNQSYIEKYIEIKNKQKDLAWPKKLADKLNIECVNFSESGNSMQKMLWQFLRELDNDNIRRDDLILFSQTKPDRNVYFDKEPIAFQVSSPLSENLKSIIGVGTYGNARTVLDQDADRSITKWFNDDRILWDFLGTLFSISYFAKMFNIRVVPAMRFESYQVQEYNREIFIKCRNNLAESGLYLGTQSLDDFKFSSEDNHLWGHPVEAVHDRYADYLYKELCHG